MTLLQDFSGVVRELFVETGTNTGNTLEKASALFDWCISIEQNDKLYAQCIERFKRTPNVVIHHGDSVAILNALIDFTSVRGTRPTTFWLDAHYFENSDTLGRTGQCPLLGELQAILRVDWKVQPIILIDDAFMFDDNIPHPGSTHCFWTSNESNHTVYNRREWPRIEEIDALLSSFKKSIRGEFILQYGG